MSGICHTEKSQRLSILFQNTTNLGFHIPPCKNILFKVTFSQEVFIHGISEIYSLDYYVNGVIIVMVLLLWLWLLLLLLWFCSWTSPQSWKSHRFVPWRKLSVTKSGDFPLQFCAIWPFHWLLIILWWERERLQAWLFRTRGVNTTRVRTKLQN